MRRSLLAALWLASGAGAYLVGARTSGAPMAAAPVSPALRASCPVVASGGGLSAAVVRAIVREELAAHAPVPGAAEETEMKAEAEAAEPRPELLRAHAIVDEAMARGRWGETDRDRLRHALATLSQREAEEVLGVLAPAINSGRFQVDVVGPML